jgi:hypothetical protein
MPRSDRLHGNKRRKALLDAVSRGVSRARIPVEDGMKGTWIGF